MSEFWKPGNVMEEWVLNALKKNYRQDINLDDTAREITRELNRRLSENKAASVALTENQQELLKMVSQSNEMPLVKEWIELLNARTPKFSLLVKGYMTLGANLLERVVELDKTRACAMDTLQVWRYFMECWENQTLEVPEVLMDDVGPEPGDVKH